MRWAAGKSIIDDINYVFPFGKWKDSTVEEVLREDPEYLYWLEENGVFGFSWPILDLITTASYEVYQERLR